MVTKEKHPDFEIMAVQEFILTHFTSLDTIVVK